MGFSCEPGGTPNSLDVFSTLAVHQWIGILEVFLHSFGCPAIESGFGDAPLCVAGKLQDLLR